MRRPGWLLLIAGFALAALNLRPALAGLSPVLGAIMDDLALGPAAGGAITTVMVVCLGLLGPAAPLISTRFGLDRALLVGLLVLAVGAVVRSSDGLFGLYGGAVLVGTAIAIMNVVMPGLVKQHFPEKIGLFTGVYVSCLVAGAAGASALAVPLADAYGWRVAAGSAALLAVVAAVVWIPQAWRPVPVAKTGPRPFRRLLRSRVTWFVTAFMGLQSMSFYIMLAWLPTIFQDAGLPADQAGYLLSLTNLIQIAVTLSVPIIAGRARSQVPHVTGAAVLTFAGYLAVLLAPATLPWLWMIILGVGQGASIALALLIITLRAPDPTSVTALSAIAQSFGYLLAALGPFVIGLLNQLTGGWTWPLVAGLAVCVIQLVFGLVAARPVVITKEEATIR
ncbi:MFS transporter [Acrocarpospora pleiomorpha]|uniref:MFS transporter n=1 Tax=Acrocarpospora pleiomorpha TaxID=90975 RepID=A0A5M3XJN9_9ACTN|nr:MFS transporter [Acrocarpospora pleiomorpha]GES21170.1 MFS transporter [Acrocarpospora pleiomorpha]